MATWPRSAGQLGQKTVVIEKDKAGGRCLNYACIPAKTVLHTAEVFAEVTEDGADLVKLERRLDRLEGGADPPREGLQDAEDGVAMLWKKNKVDFIQGEASSPAAAR